MNSDLGKTFEDQRKSCVRKLEDDFKLSVADAARLLVADFKITFRSAETTLHSHFKGQSYHPRYVKWIKKRFGIELIAPPHVQPKRSSSIAA